MRLTTLLFLVIFRVVGALASDVDSQTQSKPAWELMHNIPGYEYGDHNTIISPDGTRVLVTYGGRNKIVDVASGKEVSHLEKTDKRLIGIFSPDGKILSGFPYDKADGRTAYIWNASEGKIIGEFTPPNNVKLDQCFPFLSPDKKRILSECSEGLLIWDLSELTHVRLIRIKPKPQQWRPYNIPLSWNLVTGEAAGVDSDGRLLKIDVQQQTATPWLPQQKEAVKEAIWSPNGKQLLIISRDNGIVAVWDASSKTVVAGLTERDFSHLEWAAWSPKGKQVMMISRKKGNVAIWDIASNTVVARISEKDVLHAKFSPDGERIVTEAQRTGVVRARWAPNYWDRWTRVWNVKSGKLIRELPTTMIVSLSSDWSYWAECGPEGVRIARFDGSDSCSFPQFFDGHGGSCVFVQNDRYLVHTNACGRVVVWRNKEDAQKRRRDSTEGE
jgi:WD40 repeat protein